MFFFAMLFLMFVVMRFAHRGRHGFARLHCYHHHYGQHPRARMQQPAQPPQPTPFERLKQQYVDGDLSDERYEEELDKLLRINPAVSFDSSSARTGAGARLI
jgi:hypothetical protein